MNTIRDTSGQDRELTHARPKLRRTLWLAGIGAAIVALVLAASPALSRIYGADSVIAASEMRTARVVRGLLLRDVSAQGRVVAANSPTLYAPTAGVVAMKVQAGDAVRTGDLLAVINSPELESRYEQEKAKLDELEIEVARQDILARTAKLESRQRVDLSRVELEVAERAAERAQLSVDRGLISKADFEQALVVRKKAALTFEQAENSDRLIAETLGFELKAKQLQFERQKYLLLDLARQVDDLNLKAPTDGIVGSVSVRERDTVAVNAPLVTLVDLSAFEVEADVPEVYVDDIVSGLDAIVQLNGVSYPATLVAISPEVISGKVIARIRFSGEPPGGLRQNQRVNARIVIESREDVLKLRRGDFVDSGGGRVAYVVEKGVATRRDIELGARGTGEVEILSGLTEGQEVVISSTDAFNGKDSIYISE